VLGDFTPKPITPKFVLGEALNFVTYFVEVATLPIMCEGFTAIGLGSSEI